ncbi:MAG: oxidoreductase [Candidatus Latescibacteria bacterium]|nr:oxidoreductase [Candidatus Latescibacterota bacterium]NIO27220.1 oxidoreductase [Candidatus Latescibacterota bacterium]NIO54744.1 oxidoreductase [Candidatus Latescibacterota bacterium]NIT00827.1 oxidoreductase [Candidatus Latescibacterota bacterium]NIT37750.1 oxidoreductase [Candidatus Latescibacterota bacterium]
MGKPKLALYWAASCGGCEIAVLDIEEKILEVDASFDIVFWPCAMDFKVKDVEAKADGEIDICLFNGGIRTSENEHMAKLLRQKSKVMVAFGSCAHEGCIPGLANLYTREGIFERIYFDTQTTNNPEKVIPRPSTKVPEGELEIPVFNERLKPLDGVVKVDYYVPGCPPQPRQVWAVLEHLIQGKPPPPVGSVLGAENKTCCDECPRTREEKKIRKFYRLHEITVDENKCLMDEGIICCGPATRSGCGALCVSAGIPCRGCYGPPPDSPDQGAKMLAALSSVIDSQDPDEIQAIINTIEDPVGTFYRFSLAHSMIERNRK